MENKKTEAEKLAGNVNSSIKWAGIIVFGGFGLFIVTMIILAIAVALS